MPTLEPKICLTASGCLIHEGKVLLVKHKKLKIWLKPGGHIEPNEYPHAAAIREFWEETGIKTRVAEHGLIPGYTGQNSEFFSTPIGVNLHWVSKQNYENRLAQGDQPEREAQWQKGCEQHYNFDYLLEPDGPLEFRENVEETDGIAWFGPDEIDDLETTEDIKNEIKYAFTLAKHFKRK